MDIDMREELFHQAKTWVKEAGEIIRNRIKDPLTIDTKSDAKDLVTQMDRAIEYFFVKRIKEAYPSHQLLSEEGYGDDVTTLDGTVWIIDPIDGTMNFVQQKRNFAISVGVFHDGIGEIGLIYNVIDDVLYTAQRNNGAFKNDQKLPTLNEQVSLDKSVLGLNHFWLCENRLVDEKVMQKLVKKVRGARAYGSAALEFAFVAEGTLEGYLAMGLAPWDVAAGMVIVNEVGGVTSNIDGISLNLLQKDTVLTCHPAVHQKIITEYIQKGRK
ncbi:myo-inositol-1(or 4)-monophosphatase [Oceanobacillus limi]|uniref:inositol-phosphate phosphatase n=1 Tax=Oceanobacillus limi TaxID=930131 RepID=A0A1I0DAZ6_9BACI|nr:inositol monophosphatase family protein [Oceanobacillus limi]SET29403.1 myo-inositol-1(or 4)-monophosphatase [Oceanobacillus limi]